MVRWSCASGLFDGRSRPDEPLTVLSPHRQAPYYVSVIPGGEPNGAVLKTLVDGGSSTQYTWNVDLAAGTSITIQIKDASGSTNYSDKVTIGAGSDTSCVNNNVAVYVRQGFSLLSSDSVSRASDTDDLCSARPFLLQWWFLVRCRRPLVGCRRCLGCRFVRRRLGQLAHVERRRRRLVGRCLGHPRLGWPGYHRWPLGRRRPRRRRRRRCPRLRRTRSLCYPFPSPLQTDTRLAHAHAPFPFIWHRPAPARNGPLASSDPTQIIWHGSHFQPTHALLLQFSARLPALRLSPSAALSARRSWRRCSLHLDDAFFALCSFCVRESRGPFQSAEEPFVGRPTPSAGSRNIWVAPIRSLCPGLPTRLLHASTGVLKSLVSVSYLLHSQRVSHRYWERYVGARGRGTVDVPFDGVMRTPQGPAAQAALQPPPLPRQPLIRVSLGRFLLPSPAPTDPDRRPRSTVRRRHRRQSVRGRVRS